MRREPDQSVTASLGLGGNVGDVPSTMLQALRMIDGHPDCSVTAVSRLYTTPPWGKTDQDWFINACALVETSLDIHSLLDLLQAAERDAGRERRERWGPRTLDIDILLFGDQTISDERLTVPHRHMLERAFVLVPLADIAASAVVKGKTVLEWSRHADREGMAVADRQISLTDVKKRG